MLADLRAIFEARGFIEGHRSARGHFVVERAFVER
jgi:ferredoxin/flavodoxin---NADP+ reductase